MKSTTRNLVFLIPAIILCSGFFIGASPRNTSKNNKLVGAAAYELLSAFKPAITIEIQYMPGYKLRSSTIENLIVFIQTHLNKPGGIQLIEKEIPSAKNSNLSTAEIGLIEKNYRTAYTTAQTVAVYILVTNGASTDSEVLGTAYRNTSIAIFGKTISRYANGHSLTVKSKFESSTIQHEFGHLLGLVNLPATNKANDSVSSRNTHCDNSNCLMYFKAHGTELASYTKGGNLLAFDPICRASLISRGGK